jgi:hypothetical protein
MVLSLNQFRVVYDKFLLEFLKEGVVPSFDDVVSRAGDELPSTTTPNAPITRYIPQTSDSVFDIVLFNKHMETILMDLGILFDEANQIQINNSKRILHADLFHDVHSYELGRLTNELDSLLFTLGGADDNFFARFDNLSDTVKTNTLESTPGIVNTHEGALALPISLKGALKLGMSHLVSLSTPPDIAASRENAFNRGSIPGTKFGNTFLDATNAWGVIFESKEGGPLEISFNVRLSKEEFINRITTQHHSDKPQRLTIRTSVDKINVKDILAYSGGVISSDQSKILSFDFEDTLVDYLHVTLKKEESDSFSENSDGSGVHTYTFGLKNLSIFVTGRERDGLYQSTHFDFSDDLSAIGKVAISAKETIPDGTSIEWSVAGVNSDGEQIGAFIPVTPQSRSSASGSAKEIILQDVNKSKNTFISTSANITKVDSLSNIDFFHIHTLDTSPVFGTAALFRGYKSWLRDKSQAVNPVLVKDNFTPFSQGDTQSLYNVITEIVRPSIVNLEGTNVHVLVANKKPLYASNKGHFLTPDEDQNSSSDAQPNYAIYKAEVNLQSLLQTVTTTWENGVEVGTAPDITRTKNLGFKIIKYEGPGDIVIERQTGTNYTYSDGIDYIVKLESGFPTGEIIGIHSDFLEPDAVTTLWVDVKVKFEFDPDITRHVLEINGHQVFFNLPPGGIPSGRDIIIKYRHVTESILKSSLKVKAGFGIAGESVIYIQGVDYVFDSSSGTIQRLSTGSIPDQSDAYVDYKFNDIAEAIEQFFIWGKSTNKDGATIVTEKLNGGLLTNDSSLVINSEAGEEFLASIEGVGLVSIGKSSDWPLMSGYTQFVVKSKDPDEFPDALINQLIKLKDQDGSFIFIQGGKYFSELTSLREPLTQVSYPFLRTNVLINDQRYFAVREVLQGGTTVQQVVVNTRPNENSNFYSYVPENDVAGTGSVGLVPAKEEWRIQWVSKESNASAITKVAVRARLTRQVGVSENITPKVDSYFIKTSY